MRTNDPVDTRPSIYLAHKSRGYFAARLHVFYIHSTISLCNIFRNILFP